MLLKIVFRGGLTVNGLDQAVARARTRRRLPAPPARRLLRERIGLTQDDLARALGVTRPAISRWETGERNPRGRMLESYLAVLDRLAVEETRA